MTKDERLRFYELYKDVYQLRLYEEAVKAENDSVIDKMNTCSKAGFIIESICNYIVKQKGYAPEEENLFRNILYLRDERILNGNVLDAFHRIRIDRNVLIHPKLWPTLDYDNTYDTEIILNSLVLCVKWFYKYHLKIKKTESISRERGMVPKRQNVVVPVMEYIKVKQPVVKKINSENSIGTEGIRDYIRVIFQDEKAKGKSEVVLVSGDIHKDLNLSSRLPSVCNAMTSLMKLKDKIIYQPPLGRGSRLKIRYYL